MVHEIKKWQTRFHLFIRIFNYFLHITNIPCGRRVMNHDNSIQYGWQTTSKRKAWCVCGLEKKWQILSYLFIRIFFIINDLSYITFLLYGDIFNFNMLISFSIVSMHTMIQIRSQLQVIIFFDKRLSIWYLVELVSSWL